MRITAALCSLAFIAASTFVTAQTSAPTTPVRVGGLVKAPERIKYVAPVYPDIAAAARVSGIVIIEAVIGTDGSVTDAKVVRSIALLDQAALNAVKQWKYTPTMLNGKAVPLIMTVTVNFTPPAGTAASTPAADSGQAAAPSAPRRDPDIDYTDANIKLTITVTDKGAGAPQTKVATMFVANLGNGRLRSQGNRGAATMNADAYFELRKSGLVKVNLSVTYEPASDPETPPFSVSQSAALFLKDGVNTVVVQAADPTKNGRSVTIDVTANIVK